MKTLKLLPKIFLTVLVLISTFGFSQQLDKNIYGGSFSFVNITPAKAVEYLEQYPELGNIIYFNSSDKQFYKYDGTTHSLVGVDTAIYATRDYANQAISDSIPDWLFDGVTNYSNYFTGFENHGILGQTYSGEVFIGYNEDGLEITAFVDSSNYSIFNGTGWTSNGMSISLSNGKISVSDDWESGLFQGLSYKDDYSANYTDRSLIDKGYADANYKIDTTKSFIVDISNQDNMNKIELIAGQGIYGDGWVGSIGIDFSGAVYIASQDINTGKIIENTVSIEEGNIRVADNGAGNRSESFMNDEEILNSITDGNYTSNLSIYPSYSALSGMNEDSYCGLELEVDEGANLFLYSGIQTGEEVSFNISADQNNSYFMDNRDITEGILYHADYSSGFTERSLIDKGYADANYMPLYNGFYAFSDEYTDAFDIYGINKQIDNIDANIGIVGGDDFIDKVDLSVMDIGTLEYSIISLGKLGVNLSAGDDTDYSSIEMDKNSMSLQSLNLNWDNYTNTKINDVGATSLITKGYADATYVKAEISVTPPASATATGTAGTVIYTADYIYVCTATDTWKRTAISTWP